MKAPSIANVGALAAAGTFLLCASVALAQTPAAEQSTASAQADQAATTAPLKLQLPEQGSWPQAGGADSPGVYYGDHDEDDYDNGVQVHGSVTTGIGYSKGYGTSTMNAVELHISKPYGDGKTFDMHIHAEKTDGPGFSPYGYGYPYGGYGPRYR